MSEQNKDNLENFFRERARHHNLEFHEGDWLKLERQLDREMPVMFTFMSFLKKFWLLPLLLLILPLSWSAYNYLSKTSQHEAQAVINDIPDPTGKTEERTAKESEFSKKTPDSEGHANTLYKAGDEPPVDLGGTDGNAYAFERKNDATSIIRNPGNKSKTNDIGYAVLENGAESKIHREDFMLHFLSPLTPVPAIGKTQTDYFIEYEPVSLNAPGSSKTPSFSVGIGYSPDFSTVGIGNFVSPGSRWTMLMEYGISKRFMINTGAVWVNNKYETYGEDYHAPARYWKKGIAADEAYGECTMVDVPLNLRYNFLTNGRNQAFVSAGASTYFLLKEDYYFHYRQDDPELPDHWGTDKMTVYPFGIVNFSIGYQYQLARKSAIQIEPFIKIPTTGIGWGKVDLHTLGIYFIYKYHVANK
ncbi:MAG: PorT family protein [Cytophagales bacterium]|nr:PorT family protein [Cytophagales bacterium]